MLKTYIENNKCSLNNEVERQYFIAGCKHSYFIEEQVQRERDIPAYQHKFLTESLLVTIAGYLELPNSPTKRNIYGRANHLSRNGYLSPQTAKVHSLEGQNVDEYYPDDANDVDDENLSYAYNAAVNVIRSNPTGTVDKPCLVCQIVNGKPPNDKHRFEDCPLLQNMNLMQDNYKNMCKLIMRHRMLQKPSSIKRQNVVSFDVDSNSSTSDRSECNVDTPPESPTSDFHSGRP